MGGDDCLALAGGEIAEFLGRRPLPQEDIWSVSAVFDCEIPVDVKAGAFKPMMRFVTLLAVEDIAVGLFVSDKGTSSTGDATGFSPDELFFPKLNFHFDVFFVTTGTGGGWLEDSKGKSFRCFDEERDALLISRARDWEAVASVSSVSSVGEPRLRGEAKGAAEPLPFLAPRFRRLVVDVEREYVLSSYCSSES